MTNKERLKDIAEKFPEDIKDVEKFVNKANYVTVDYLDGLVDFWCKDPEAAYDDPGTHLGGLGGNSTDIVNRYDYQYFWDHFVSQNRKFIDWCEEHNISHKDLMSLSITFNDNQSSIECNFYF